MSKLTLTNAATPASTLFLEPSSGFKGTMSPQAHARVDEKHFENGWPNFIN